MTRPRVVQVLEAAEGGTRTHVRELMAGLDDAAFDLVAVVSTRRSSRLAEELGDLARRRAIRVEVVAEMVRDPSPREDLAAIRRLTALFRELRPDIVHTHGSKGGFLGRVAARRARVPRVVHTPHVYPFQWVGGLRGRFYLALERFLARRTDRVVLLGPRQREIALRARVATERQAVVIENGVEPSEFPALSAGERASLRSGLDLSANELAVGMVGRLVPQKGVGQFVRAARIVHEAEPAAVFLLVGEGPLETEVRRRAREGGLSERSFRLLGHREDAARLYAAFDVFCLASLWEGMPYVVLEAMAARAPVVATKTPGVLDIVEEGRTGLLAELADPADIAARLLALLRDRGERDRLAAAGRAAVEARFTRQGFLEKHATLYRELAGAAGVGVSTGDAAGGEAGGGAAGRAGGAGGAPLGGGPFAS